MGVPGRACRLPFTSRHGGANPTRHAAWQLGGVAIAPRLTSLPPRFGSLTPRVGTLSRGAKRDRSAAPWRSWYSTKRWSELRLKVLERDGYICQRSGVVCSGVSPEPNSPVVNHRIPHRGDPALFWDETNLETVTKQVHDTIIQAEEQGSLHTRGDWD